MSYINNFIRHFMTITEHKIKVAEGCFKVGLYRQGLFHDMSKYMPSEFLVGVKYYQGNRSPNNAEREDTGYSSAWLHHKGRNKHHFEYWIDYSSECIPGGMMPVKMPKKYLVEMFMDRVAASKVYKGKDYKDSDPFEYFQIGKGRLMHEKTRRQLYVLLKMLAEKGEEETYAYIRKRILKKKR